MVKFPREGKCAGIHEDLIKYLKNRPGSVCSLGPADLWPSRKTGIGWNGVSYWFLVNLDNSTKPLFLYTALKNKFFKSKTIELW